MSIYPEFSKMLHTDKRVTPVLRTCLKCDAELPDASTAGDEAMLLFTQCPKCKTVFVLDAASFGARQRQ
jgi:phage FluMu protein Com